MASYVLPSDEGPFVLLVPRQIIALFRPKLYREANKMEKVTAIVLIVCGALLIWGMGISGEFTLVTVILTFTALGMIIYGALWLRRLNKEKKEAKKAPPQQPKQVAPVLPPDAYEFRRYKVVGVTFDNDDGSSRQEILKQMHFREPPYNKPFDLELRPYDYEGEQAVAVCAAGQMIGNISRDDLPEVLGNWKRTTAICDVDVYGGGAAPYGHELKYGAKVTLKLLKNTKEAVATV